MWPVPGSYCLSSKHLPTSGHLNTVSASTTTSTADRRRGLICGRKNLRRPVCWSRRGRSRWPVPGLTLSSLVWFNLILYAACLIPGLCACHGLILSVWPVQLRLNRCCNNVGAWHRFAMRRRQRRCNGVNVNVGGRGGVACVFVGAVWVWYLWYVVRVGVEAVRVWVFVEAVCLWRLYGRVCGICGCVWLRYLWCLWSVWAVSLVDWFVWAGLARNLWEPDAGLGENGVDMVWVCLYSWYINSK